MMLCCQTCGPDCSVMNRRMMFCIVICQISRVRAPVVTKCSISCSAAKPVELSVYGFEVFACNVGCYVTKCCCIVGLHRRQGMFVPHLFEGMAC